MSTSTGLFPAPGYERDPRFLPRLWVPQGKLAAFDQATATTAFWSYIDAIGDYQTSSPAGNTTRTVVSVSGSPGIFYGAIGPGGNTDDQITTWTITIDGYAYTVSQAGLIGARNSRGVLGAILAPVGLYTTSSMEGGLASSTDVEARRSNNTTAAVANVTVQQVRRPDLIPRAIPFYTSLKVEVALSGTLDGSTNAAYAGVIWQAV